MATWPAFVGGFRDLEIEGGDNSEQSSQNNRPHGSSRALPPLRVSTRMAHISFKPCRSGRFQRRWLSENTIRRRSRKKGLGLTASIPFSDPPT
jgi:hypothetical protein